MIVQYVGSRSSHVDQRSLLLQKLRSNLINLRQFEDCYILARWIRNLFEDTVTQQWRSPSPSPPRSTDRDPSPFPEPSTEGSPPGTVTLNFDTSTGTSGEPERLATGVENSTVFDMDFFYMLQEGEDQTRMGFPSMDDFYDSRHSTFTGDIHF
jgi:hypothetical protein